MTELAYNPVSMAVSMLGGMLAGMIFKQVWKLAAREEDALKATGLPASGLARIPKRPGERGPSR